MPFLALLTFTFAALLAGLVAGALLNRKALEARREAKVIELFGSIETLPTYFRDDEVFELPEPAQRFFERNLHEGMPHHSCVRVQESGSVRQRVGQPWTEFVGEGYLTSTPAAHVWFARLRPFPLVWIDEMSLLRDGRAHLSSKLLSSVTTSDAHDQAALVGALLRYIVHLPLIPGAMISADDRGWREEGENAARFWLRSGELEVSGVFHFDEFGNATHFTTDQHTYEGSQTADVALWTARYSEHRCFGDTGDLQLPTKMELEWELDGERFPYLDKTFDEWRLDVPHSWQAHGG